MSRHPAVPADVDPTDLADLLADAVWMQARDVEASALRGATGRRVAVPGPRTWDITDRCVDLTRGFGE